MAYELEPNAGTSWLHLALLLGVVSLLEIGRASIGDGNVFMFPVFARTLYVWLPALAGISVSILGTHRSSSRSGPWQALAVIGLMIVLDLTGGLSLGGETAAALYPDASVMAQASESALVSWTRTLFEWVQGDLSVPLGVSQNYAFDDPRVRVAQAVSNGSMILLALASVGFVVAAMSWVRAHVIFRRAQDVRTFCIVLAWLIAPMVVELSRHFSAQQRFRVLFRGAPLWTPAVAPVLITALGLFAWWYTARYRGPDDA